MIRLSDFEWERDHSGPMAPTGQAATQSLHSRQGLYSIGRSPIPKKREESFAKQSIDAFHGMARFSGPDTVLVEGRAIKGRNIVIAAGARPVPLGFPGAEHAITSDAFLELEDLPQRIIIVGGGYIAAEFSHIAARGWESDRAAKSGAHAYRL